VQLAKAVENDGPDQFCFFVCLLSQAAKNQTWILKLSLSKAEGS